MNRRRWLALCLGMCVVAVVMGPAAAGEEMVAAWRGGPFRQPQSVPVDPTDGSCRVADTGSNQVVHLGADGSELWRGGALLRPET